MKHLLYLAATLLFAPALPAAIIGTNVPAQPLTMERISTLPWKQRLVWKDYLKHSQRQMKADKAFLAAEMREHGLKESTSPPEPRRGAGGFRNRPARPPEWYGNEEARRMADDIISFQTPAGGWSKNLDLTSHPRAPGERFAAANIFTNRTAADRVVDFDEPLDVGWNYVGTFDNSATITQLRFLAKVISASGTNSSTPYRRAFRHGLDYTFAAQYPNGGWPQVWPLEGGYHDHVTYNDNATINIMNLLREVSLGTNEFAFVPSWMRQRAVASLARAVDCILKCRITANGQRTVWCQQHDELTLQPASARNYEMPSACAPESSAIVSFLMKLPDPKPEVCAAIRDAVTWLEKTQITGFAFRRGPEGRELIADPEGEPLWARYYEVGSDRPIFGDRDKTIHDTLAEISKERRNGYAWYGNSATNALEEFASWDKQHPAK